jgi:uncharacterized protein YcgL (UPF0745 family)
MKKICNIYKSSREEGMYLYIEKKDDFSDIPEGLLKKFGEPVFVMRLAIDKNTKLARVDSSHVLEMIQVNNFYLQMPLLSNSEINWLHKKNSKM